MASIATTEQARETLARRIGHLDAWLETMRQPEGYGGPVAHWWQSSFVYVGPGLDWRYQGLLAGYARLAEKVGQPVWRRRMAVAADHLIAGQLLDGGYPQSRFEGNPGTLGTPHEAAASHGLIMASPYLDAPEAAVMTVTRNLDHLIAKLWDADRGGFRDAPNSGGRVPNKLATLAEALMAAAEQEPEAEYLRFARAALDDVVRFQESHGVWVGAIHQWSPDNRRGDGRFFPLYNARCVPALLTGAAVFAEPRYAEAAHGVLRFLEASRHDDGTWPQVVYANGRRTEFPHWIAALADILWAYRAAGLPLPAAALERLVDGQQPTGGFQTAEGFADRFRAALRPRVPDYRDIVGVVGWNDKVLRLLADLLPPGATVRPQAVEPMELLVAVADEPVIWQETPDRVVMMRCQGRREVIYQWDKRNPWAAVYDPRLVG
jgi:hypothetical protein